jgi:Domain of unknown function (DUF4062)
MNVKYQIFVSSAYEDLKDERNEVIKACLSMGDIPVGMEMFNAADEEQWAVITRTIDQCDYYVVIVAHRYGSMVDGVSFTEKEYDYAVLQGVPVLGFVIADGASWPNDRIDKDQAAIETLRAFKSKVQRKMVRYWRDKSQLQAQFAISLGTYKNTNPRRGWVQAPAAGDTDVAQTLSNLSEENARLRQTLDEIRSTSKPDEVDEAISLLGIDIDNRPIREMFMRMMEISKRGEVDQNKLFEGELKVFELWGFIGPHPIRGINVMMITELGYRVYKRLDWERRSTDPDAWRQA